MATNPGGNKTSNKNSGRKDFDRFTTNGAGITVTKKPAKPTNAKQSSKKR